jgi:DeoR/GlpR family transcriptional regulator of sugar metabolism
VSFRYTGASKTTPYCVILQVFLNKLRFFAGFMQFFVNIVNETTDCDTAMLKKERQAFILKQVNLHNRVLCSDLCEEIAVSEDTIRRDLNELSDEGRVIKVHGGALSVSFHHSRIPLDVYALDKKRIIAHKAAELVKDGMFVLTTGGTTIVELAKLLPATLKATFVTGSLPAAFEYMHHPNIEVIIIGDKLSKQSQITVGGEAITRIRQIRADICFLGTNAFDIDHGLTDNDWEVVQLKKAMIESSDKVVSLAISEKIGTVQRIKVADASAINTLVTELNTDDAMLSVYRDNGIEVL